MGDEVAVAQASACGWSFADHFADANAVFFVSNEDAHAAKAKDVIAEHFGFSRRQVERHAIEQVHVAFKHRRFAGGLRHATDAFAGGDHVQRNKGRVQTPFEVVVA